MLEDNKRGQEGLTMTTLLLIVLGVVAVVVLILFFTGTFDKISGVRDVLPGNLAAASQACRLAIEANLVSDYCYNYRKLSEEQYSNCMDLRIKEPLEAEGLTVIECNGALIGNAKREICNSITNEKKKGKIFFNGEIDNNCARL